MMNERGPENKISRVSAAGFKGRICPCCINTDIKGRRLSFGIPPFTPDDVYVRPKHIYTGRKRKGIKPWRREK